MKKLHLFLLSITCISAYAQNYNPSDRDPGFNQFNYPLNHLFVDTDVDKSKVVAGDKIFVITSSKLIKMNGNSLDNSFNTGTGFLIGGQPCVMGDVVEQPDGKVLVGGNFNTYNGITKYKLVRLNPDGSLDSSFNALLSGVANWGVLEIYLQADGKIVCIADSSLTGSGYNNIFRLNANGSVDTSFVISPNYRFNAAAIQPDGKIVVSHGILNDFYTFNKIDRLNIDGSFDTSFTTASVTIGSPGSPSVNKICIQNDGKILVAGLFAYCAGSPFRDLARLSSTGSADTSFNIGSGFLHSASSGSYLADLVYGIIIQPDNKIVVSGNFTSFNSVARQDIVRLEQNGPLITALQTSQALLILRPSNQFPFSATRKF